MKSNEIDSQLHPACYDGGMNSTVVPQWGPLPAAPSELSALQRHALTVGVVLTHGALAAAIVMFARETPSLPEPQAITVELVTQAPETVLTPPAPAKVEAPPPPVPQPPKPVVQPSRPTPTPPVLSSRQQATANDMVAPPVTEVRPQPVAPTPAADAGTRAAAVLRAPSGTGYPASTRTPARHETAGYSNCGWRATHRKRSRQRSERHSRRLPTP